MKIIINGDGYPEKRNIIVSSENKYINLKKQNIWFYINAVRRKLFRKNKLFIFQALPSSVPEDANVIHLFNEVAKTNKKWVSTFETEIPRVLPVAGIPKAQNPELRKELQLAASPQCIGLIAISEATRKIQLMLMDSFPQEKDKITTKLHVMHPPQALLHEVIRDCPTGKINFTFIGNEFYRKGGAEVVLAFSELAEEGAINPDDVQVNIVGDLARKHNIAHRGFQDGAEFHSRTEQLIKKHAFFRHDSFLPAPKVIELIKQTQVGLLPTWQDTYGFSVLEMQACGCPVISTNVRALPEINPESSGWLIKAPLSAMYEYDIPTEAAKNELRKAIVTQLKACILDALNNREGISQRSAEAIARITREHDPRAFRDRLNQIYAGA